MKFSFLSTSLSMGAVALCLAGCTSGPNAMPTGYKYHSEVYKSPNPPPTPKLTAKQRKYMDVEQAEQFRDGVYELLVRITDRAGMPPKPVYILRPEPMTAFYANIDNDLRESMRSIGYVLADSPENAYVFSYDAKIIGRHDSYYVNHHVPNPEISTGMNNVELTLKIFNGAGTEARMLTHEVGAFFIKGAELLHIERPNYNLLPTAWNRANNEDLHEPPHFVTTMPQVTSKPVIQPEQVPMMGVPYETLSPDPVLLNTHPVPLNAPSVPPIPLNTPSVSLSNPADMSPPLLEAQEPIVAEHSSVGAYIDDNGTLQRPEALVDERPMLGTSMRGRISKATDY